MKLDRLRFGPAGYPIDSPKERAFSYLKEIGLDGMEYQAVRSIPRRESTLLWIRREASKNDIALSLHAPYAINLASESDEKRKASVLRLIRAAKAAHKMGAKHVTFHTGYYGSMGREEALKVAIKELSEVAKEVGDLGLEVDLGPETTGKRSQIGSLEDVIRMAQEVDLVVPTVDFAHIHVRDGGVLRGKADYERVIQELEDGLGTLDGLVIHFTEVEPTKSGFGERMHHEIGSGYGPDFRPLAEIMAEVRPKWLVVSESPLLERDALKMREMFLEAVASLSHRFP